MLFLEDLFIYIKRMRDVDKSIVLLQNSQNTILEHTQGPHSHILMTGGGVRSDFFGSRRIKRRDFFGLRKQKRRDIFGYVKKSSDFFG